MFHGTLSHSFAQAIPVTDAKDLESTVTLIDLGGTASDIDLISIPIILKDDEFAQFIQTLNTDKDRNRTWGEFFKKYGDPKDLHKIKEALRKAKNILITRLSKIKKNLNNSNTSFSTFKNIQAIVLITNKVPIPIFIRIFFISYLQLFIITVKCNINQCAIGIICFPKTF